MVRKPIRRFLQQRSEVYYFRWCIPKDTQVYISKRELVQSLRTNDLYIAYKRAIPLYDMVIELKHVMDSFKMSEITEQHLRSIYR